MLSVMRVLYTGLLYFAAPFVLARLWWRGRRQPEYRRRFGERFGFVRAPNQSVVVWVHAVSVGESVAAFPLIEALIARHGECRVWVTTTTPTGSERVLARFGERVHHSYVPYDWPGAVRRFVKHVKPQCVVVMETELWPNLFHHLARRSIPLVIANARLSRRSFSGYSRLPRSMAAVLGDCSLVAAQSDADAKRFQKLGAVRVKAMGNLKFDLDVPENQRQAGAHLRTLLGTTRPVWVAASTHDGEERAMLSAQAEIRKHFPDALLILVPRHPERFDKVASLANTCGNNIMRRSALSRDEIDGAAVAKNTTVLLGDSMGEMFTYLAAADVAFVGGSLVDIGGHNILEPAALGLPVVFGPHMHNFEAARSLLLGRDAAREVGNVTELAAAVCELFENLPLRKKLGDNGRCAMADNRGCLARLLESLEEFVVYSVQPIPLAPRQPSSR